jgi:peptidoglycan LD-endopeptidase CwlK
MEPLLEKLIPEFQRKVITLIQNCQNKNVTIKVYTTLRDPFKQAKLWRQSRTTEEIQEKVQELKGQKAFFLASCITSVGKQFGKHVTNAIPGLSWHQWGEAIDAVWVVNGEAEWDTSKLVNGVNGNKVYANEAKALGLDAGLLWANFKDSPHVQYRQAANPLTTMSLAEIDAEMEKRFG